MNLKPLVVIDNIGKQFMNKGRDKIKEELAGKKDNNHGSDADHNIDIEKYKEISPDGLMKKYPIIDDDEHINSLPGKASNFIAYVDMEKYLPKQRRLR